MRHCRLRARALWRLSRFAVSAALHQDASLRGVGSVEPATASPACYGNGDWYNARSCCARVASAAGAAAHRHRVSLRRQGDELRPAGFPHGTRLCEVCRSRPSAFHCRYPDVAGQAVTVAGRRSLSRPGAGRRRSAGSGHQRVSSLLARSARRSSQAGRRRLLPSTGGSRPTEIALETASRSWPRRGGG